MYFLPDLMTFLGIYLLIGAIIYALLSIKEDHTDGTGIVLFIFLWPIGLMMFMGYVTVYLVVFLIKYAFKLTINFVRI